jgi:hypothetical protein
MAKLSLEDIEFIKILANSDATLLEKGMNKETKTRLESKIGMILRQYYAENTMGEEYGWVQEFENASITEDDGKAAIACARRLGVNIS